MNPISLLQLITNTYSEKKKREREQAPILLPEMRGEGGGGVVFPQLRTTISLSEKRDVYFVVVEHRRGERKKRDISGQQYRPACVSRREEERKKGKGGGTVKCVVIFVLMQLGFRGSGL